VTSATAKLRGPLRKRESHLWIRHPEDFYVEPEWCSARLFEEEQFYEGILDPACGIGRIVMAAKAAGFGARGADIVRRLAPTEFPFLFTHGDFLRSHPRAPNIVCNPPFGIAEKFVSHALSLASRKVAMLLPANWIQGDKRSRWLETTPLHRVWFVTPRPSMPPGPAIMAGQKPGNGTTDYAWFVWKKDYDGRAEVRWLRKNKSLTPVLL
jgi:hypothetical protein